MFILNSKHRQLVSFDLVGYMLAEMSWISYEMRFSWAGGLWPEDTWAFRWTV